MRFKISGIDFIYTKDMQITRKINEHSCCEIKVVVKNEVSTVINKYKSLISQPISLSIIEEKNGSEKNIFSGYIEDVEIGISNIECVLTLRCYSNSKKDDKEKNTVIFQSTEKTIGDIVKKIKFNSNITFLENGIEEIEIYNPVVQNNETNFNFVRRIISKNRKCIISESLLSSTRIWVGKREGNSYKLGDNYTEIKFKEKKNFIEVCLINQHYELGDILEILSEKYYIVESKTIYRDEVCYCNYILTKEYEDVVEEENSLLDRKFLGEVIENKDEKLLGRVQIKFKEEKEMSGEKYWYKILTPYVSKDTGFYMTPSKGETVIVEFNEEIEPYILGSIREQGHENFENPNNLFIKNDYGKEFNITEKEINIISLFDKVFISLDEEKIEINNGTTGIYVEKDKITFQNEKGLFVIDDKITLLKDSGAEIVIDEKLELKTQNSQIEIDSNIEMKSEKLEVNANNIKIK